MADGMGGERPHRAVSAGRATRTERLLIPEKLYGRERETEALLAAFDRVGAQGATELVLVSGYAGIGKSSVANCTRRWSRRAASSHPVSSISTNAIFPTPPWRRPFRALCAQFSARAMSELAAWRTRCWRRWARTASSWSTCSRAGALIGNSRQSPNLPSQDAKNRFQIVFRRFLGVFARKERPLALFLDDLQWLDAATLDLLEHLATHPEARHLLLIAAYRDNEVGPAHPLTQTLEVIRKPAPGSWRSC